MGQLVDKNTIYGFTLGANCQGWYNDITPLSRDALNAIDELGLILRGIHRKMIAEGYEIENGRVRKVKSK